MKNIDTIVAQCIDDIQAGNAGLEDCLARYADASDELRPLLELAMKIRAPMDLQPSSEYKSMARTRLLEHIHAEQKSRMKPEKTSQGWFYGWSRAAVVTATVLVILVLSGTATVYASQSSLPGDKLYALKTGTEQMQRTFTLNNEAAVTLELDFAAERLEELEALAALSPDESTTLSQAAVYPMSIATGSEWAILLSATAPLSERIQMAVSGYENNISNAIAIAARTENGEYLKERVALQILEHVEKIDTIEDESSVTARQMITVCRGKAVEGQVQAIGMLAQVNPGRAAEINIQATQARLHRAEQQAEKGDDKGVEDSLKEYERLRRSGEGISHATAQRGQPTEEIDAMNSAAAEDHLARLGAIHQQVKPDTQKAVEHAMGAAAGNYGNAAGNDSLGNIHNNEAEEPGEQYTGTGGNGHNNNSASTLPNQVSAGNHSNTPEESPEPDDNPSGKGRNQQ